MTAAVCEVTVVEHGARAGAFFARCVCGWEVTRPKRWDGIVRAAENHVGRSNK